MAQWAYPSEGTTPLQDYDSVTHQVVGSIPTVVGPNPQCDMFLTSFFNFFPLGLSNNCLIPFQLAVLLGLNLCATEVAASSSTGSTKEWLQIKLGIILENRLVMSTLTVALFCPNIY